MPEREAAWADLLPKLIEVHRHNFTPEQIICLGKPIFEAGYRAGLEAGEKDENGLLPCPFCGAKAQLDYEGDLLIAACSSGNCVLSNTAIVPAVWNRRA